MNKAIRHELKMNKYKKRMRVFMAKSGIMLNLYNIHNTYALRSHGKPCSCFICSPYKYNRKKPNFKKQTIIDLTT